MGNAPLARPRTGPSDGGAERTAGAYHGPPGPRASGALRDEAPRDGTVPRVSFAPFTSTASRDATTVTTTSILLLSAVPEAARPLADALRKVGPRGGDPGRRRGGDPARRASSPSIAIDAVDPPRKATDVCAEIRRTPALAAIPVLCIFQKDDVEERVLFLEVGADDVIARPFDPRELEARVEGLLVRFKRTRDLAPQTGGEVPCAAAGASSPASAPRGAWEPP